MHPTSEILAVKNRRQFRVYVRGRLPSFGNGARTLAEGHEPDLLEARNDLRGRNKPNHGVQNRSNSTMKTTRFEAAINSKISQWEHAAEVSAARAIQAGRLAVLVTYPTGLQMMRFAEPFKGCGMHYEVSVETWKTLTANGGKVFA